MSITVITVIGLALAGAGALIALTAGRKLIRRWWTIWKFRNLYPHAPKWPDKTYWTTEDKQTRPRG